MPSSHHLSASIDNVALSVTRAAATLIWCGRQSRLLRARRYHRPSARGSAASTAAAARLKADRRRSISRWRRPTRWFAIAADRGRTPPASARAAHRATTEGGFDAAGNPGPAVALRQAGIRVSLFLRRSPRRSAAVALGAPVIETPAPGCAWRGPRPRAEKARIQRCRFRAAPRPQLRWHGLNYRPRGDCGSAEVVDFNIGLPGREAAIPDLVRW